MNYSTLISVLLCLLLSAPARADHYQVVTEEWPPYNYSENGQITGMTTEIVRAIMKVTGHDLTIVLAPSMRASLILKMRPRTIMYSMFRTPEREHVYKWVGPILEEAIHPYQLAAAPPVTSLEQLLHAPQITTRHAGLLPDMLQSLGFKNLDKSATESVQLYRMLLSDRTAIIIGDTDAGVAYQSRQLNIAPGTLRQIPIELYRSSLYIAFSRDCEDDVVDSWSSALETLRQSGELERIQRRYTQPAPQ
ncbi:transporter substrate-binding domain-containing protein [Pseudomonas alliivorans]|uniref:Transporter substrate-binding domain-containing protein n=1 Tax=Pseudomonas alliivorans TaxID=2810613 RepID=A0ABS4C107_9PSED|nr:transporter substrate-binding domain-containing protein [Pseudomonas alliivorans]MBP0944322.1 transporter substrate-binding domain-containing protein [Pseudomonas alliivorans]MEE4325385.1 transporter substrate-binding domain-containing protein [Pseudomonas alliivorans]MEE4332414.1 transporter substrate-binding domain-containing protein [Pseudomonas alliivorans]MEE4366915.1 transporter substrate-binding domain-containing protein [Pseudomonas alliivorans]MEE4662606.1 transporter substrate-bin